MSRCRWLCNNAVFTCCLKNQYSDHLFRCSRARNTNQEDEGPNNIELLKSVYKKSRNTANAFVETARWRACQNNIARGFNLKIAGEPTTCEWNHCVEKPGIEESMHALDMSVFARADCTVDCSLIAMSRLLRRDRRPPNTGNPLIFLALKRNVTRNLHVWVSIPCIRFRNLRFLWWPLEETERGGSEFAIVERVSYVPSASFLLWHIGTYSLW